MSEPWEPERLLAPISEAQPCGDNLEDSDLLASFDTFRIFGESVPLEFVPPPATDGDHSQRRESDKRIPKPREWAEWPVIRDKAAEALGKSKDLRLLSTLATALLRTDGVPGFCATLGVAATWLETHWQDAYPRVDEDAMMRRNALNNFADPMAVVEGLRRTPLVSSRQHGIFSMRDIEAMPRAQGQIESDVPQVKAAFGSMPLSALTALQQHAVDGSAALKRIEERMRDAAGTEAVPAYDRLHAVLSRMTHVLRFQVAAHPEAAAAGLADVGEQTSGMPAGTTAEVRVGAIASRQDAVRALDAVATYFRKVEPSSPIPLFVERAKRLIDKDFLEVLADVVPDAVPSARAAGGVRDSE